MWWETVLLFTVTLMAASAIRLTIDDNPLINDSMNVQMSVPTISPVYISTEIDTITTELTVITNMAEIPTTSFVTTEAAVSSTQKNEEQITGITIPEGNGGGGGIVVPEPTTSAPPEPDVSHEQIGRSSEIVGEPGGPNGEDNSDQEFIILTNRGLVQGYPWHTNPDIIAYIDIPYASFERYFQDPTPPSAWDNIHQIKEHTKRCPQLQGNTYVGDLDCLTLSIFTPVETVNASVLFHIHESNFVRGSGDPTLYGPEYFVPKGVILVLPNYRLGPLGFLCLGNSTAPGNAALKDLTLALKWVSENIRAFGGEPSNVVVSGEGTSGALVGYLALAPASSGYFTKGITESGSVLSHWALDRNPAATANILVQKIRQISNPSNSIEAADVKMIVLAAKDINFSPCIEHNDYPFLLDTPWSMLQNTVSNKTFMIGSASHAGAIEAANTNEEVIEQMNNYFESFLPSDLHFVDYNSRTNVGNRVKRQYFGNDTITLAHMEEISLCYTDSSYLGPAVRTARALFQAGARVFFFEFSFVGELNRELDSINRLLNGTVRGDIVGYIFSQDGVTPAEGSLERRMVDLMTDLWISFIDNGTPKSENITWKELNATSVTEESWLFIGEEVEMTSFLHEDRMQLWTDIYAEYFIEHNAAHKNMSDVVPLLFALLLYFGLEIKLSTPN